MKFRFLFSFFDKHKDPSRPTPLTRFLRDESGSYLVFMALALPVLVAVSALGTEAGFWLYSHRVVQSAAANAAFSAATGYATNSALDYVTQAKAIAANDYNLVDGVNGVTVAVNKPPTGSCYAGTSNYTGSNAIEVIVTQSLNTLLSKIWLAASTINVCGRAVAIVSGGGDCILATGTTGTVISTTANNLHVSLTGCSFFSNSSDPNSISVNGNNDSINAETIGTVGGVSLSGNARTTLNATTGDPPVADPYTTEAASWPTSGGTAQTNCTPVVVTVTGHGKNQTTTTTGGCASPTLSPGSYAGGITFTNAFSSYTMSPGVYYLSASSAGNGNLSLNGNNTSITGTGVTIVLTGNSVVNVTGQNSSLTLTGPTTGSTVGVAIFEPTSTGTNVIGANSFTANITGLIYTPDANVQFNGNTGNTPDCTQIIAKTVSFGGNTINFSGACSSVPGLKTFGQLVYLVE